MKYFDSGYFTYKSGNLYCEEVSIKDIVNAAGTPVYVYSKKFFEDRFKEFSEAFKEINHTIFYAAKSNFNINVIKIFSGLGSGVDVNSEGELFRALKAGANPKKMILTGVGKTSNEIKLGLEKNLLMIKAESVEEIYLINEIAQSLNKVAAVAIRVNPDVDAKSHPYISTGLAENKFGIDSKRALNIFKKEKELKHIKFTGIDMHIGSQITTVKPFVEAVQKLSGIFFQLKKDGIRLEHFDVGGGIGIVYNDEKTFSVKEYANAIIPILKKMDCDVFFEPGRFLTANGGALITETAFVKKNNAKNFAIVDAAMNDLLRPSIYSAYHHIQPVEKKENEKEIIADIVGPVCETGDFLAKSRKISEVKKGDLLAVMSAGAYGMVMASNYNARRRAPEIIVDKNKFYSARSRESFDHLLYDEKIIVELF